MFGEGEPSRAALPLPHSGGPRQGGPVHGSCARLLVNRRPDEYGARPGAALRWFPVHCSSLADCACMITFLRHFVVDSWIGRLLAILVFVAFVGWGVGDVISNLADDPSTAAVVGARKISTRELAAALQAEMPRIAQQMGMPDPSRIPPPLRQEMVKQILHRLMGQAAILESAKDYGLVVPDEVVRDEIFSMPYFKGKDGKFDRALLNSRLASAGMTEKRLISLVRDDLAGRGVLEPLTAGAHVPEFVVNRIYDYETETRVLDVLHVPFTSVPLPAVPSDAVLNTFYTAHKAEFRSPEYRHARIVILSPETVADRVQATDEEMHRLYDAESQKYHVPELRSVGMVTTHDEAAAQAVATLWKGGADWAQVQAAAKGSAVVALDDTRASALPFAGLRNAVFSAPVNEVQGPVKTENGWSVFRVTKVSAPHDTSFDEAKADLRDQIVKARAPEAVSSRVPKLQDAIAGGGLDTIPADLGAAAASGSLDRHGMTKDGEPAPLPGSPALRDAVIAQIFSQAKGAPPKLTEVPAPQARQGQPPQGSPGWYAVSVDDITPAQDQPFAAVRDKVIAAWQEDAQHQAAQQKAAALLSAAKAHGGLAAAAGADGGVQKDQMVSRARPLADAPDAFMDSVMALKSGDSAMGSDASGYVVATVTAIRHLDPKADSLGVSRVRDGMTDTLASDVSSAFIHSLEGRYKTKIIQAGVRAAANQAGFGDGS